MKLFDQPYTDDTTEQESEFVERVDSMDIDDIKQNWGNLLDEALELHPEDKK